MPIYREELADSVGYGDEELRTRLAAASATKRPLRRRHRKERPHAGPIVVGKAELLAGLAQGVCEFRAFQVDQHESDANDVESRTL